MMAAHDRLLPGPCTWKEALMALLNFRRAPVRPAQAAAQMAAFLRGHSIEVMPRTARQVADFRALLPAGTRVCIAHIDGTPIDDMIATAVRLRAEGLEPMPHFPARSIPDRTTLAEWLARYRGEADVRQGLILGGGRRTPRGAYDNSMQLLDSGLFDGFARLHVAGHPEGNRDIDPDGGDRAVMEALRWKAAFAERSDAAMAIVTQFVFEADPVVAWAARLRREGIGLPLHVGVAGPAKLQTLIRYAVACGVGASLRVLQRRARDVTRLVVPFEPTELVADLARHVSEQPALGIEGLHLFPLGGIAASADWAAGHGGQKTTPAASA